MQPIGVYSGKVMGFWSFIFFGKLGLLNCDGICMCVVNKQFELLKFVFNSIHVDLQYNALPPLKTGDVHSITYIHYSTAPKSLQTSVLDFCFPFT